MSVEGSLWGSLSLVKWFEQGGLEPPDCSSVSEGCAVRGTQERMVKGRVKWEPTCPTQPRKQNQGQEGKSGSK